LENTGSVVRKLFERRKRDFLLSKVRVTMHTSLENIDGGDFTIGSVKESEAVEFPRWVAEELVALNLAEIQEEPFESEILKALTREKMLGSLQLSSLDPDFYLKLKRKLESIRERVGSGKAKREDFEKIKANCYDLIGRRLSKLLALSSSVGGIDAIGDRLTPEEKVFFDSSQNLSRQWRLALLGEAL